MKLFQDVITKAARAIQAADVLFISAGAGIGVDSGLPDFRGNQGFWEAYPPFKKAGLSFVDMADPSWFFNDPEIAWGFYGHRFHLYQSTEPHEGFQLLKKWANTKANQPFIFTSNVDGQFQKAGFSEESIYECHGSINHFQCRSSCSQEIWSAEALTIEVDEETFRAQGELPSCLRCGEVARPNILMFGDWGWNHERSDQQSSRYRQWQSANREKQVTIIEMGAGKAIPTVRYASESIRGTLIRINPRDSDGPQGTLSIASGALEALQAIEDRMRH